MYLCIVADDTSPILHSHQTKRFSSSNTVLKEVNCFYVNTLDGRLKLPYFSQIMEKFFKHNIYKFGTDKLVQKHGKYFLHIPVTYEVEECLDNQISNVVGIDRGINFVVATSKHKSVLSVTLS